MPHFRVVLVCLALLAGCSMPAIGSEASLSLADKATLQAAMQRHVDSQSVDGALLYLDPAGDVQALHPVTAHPMILSMGPHFVLCFDFRDAKGKDVPVDFYMAKKSMGYVVFHTAVADRKLLRQLMDSGRVRRVP